MLIFCSEPSESSNNSSRSSSPKPVALVSSEHSIDVRIDSDKSASNDQQNKPAIKSDVDNDDISDNVFSILDTMYSTENQFTLTTDQSSREEEALIGGHRLRWPKFEMHDVMFEGRSYSLTLTCPLDSALFALYFIYRTDDNISEEFNNRPDIPTYSTLVKIFHIVEKEGWDAARITWLLHFHLLKTTDRKPKSLFGSVDEQVFCFIKEAQRYSEKIKCLRAECPNREERCSNTELSLRSSETSIEKFESETVGVCQTLIKRPNEITKKEAEEKQYRYGRIPAIDLETNRREYIEGWICDSIKTCSVAIFEHGHSPVIIVEITAYSKNNKDGCERIRVQLRDVKHIIRIGSVKYKLRAVIHNEKAHFTVTLVDTDGTFYYFNDRKGVQQVQHSTKFVEYGIYTRMYTFDD